MTIIESHLRAEPRISICSQLSEEIDMFLKRGGRGHVGVFAWGGPQFVIKKIQSALTGRHLFLRLYLSTQAGSPASFTIRHQIRILDRKALMANVTKE
jgi:hypothetical protein